MVVMVSYKDYKVGELIMVILIILYLICTVLSWFAVRQIVILDKRDADLLDMICCIMPMINVVYSFIFLIYIVENNKINCNEFFKIRKKEE